MRTHIGSFGKDPKEDSSHHNLVLVTALSQGGSGQLTPHKLATLKSNSDIIISMLRDQLDRS